MVVESRAKADTLQKFLGRDYKVLASIGHVRDLPKGSIGVNIVNDFDPLYIVPRDKRKIVSRIGEAARNAESVILATDPDREGEAIAWHLVGAAELDPAKVRRVTFHEITKEAIRDAMDHPTGIDMKLVDSQQARRILDRLVGFQISPLLSKGIPGANSAGRVQSVALRFVVDREREIKAFVPREWWSIRAQFSKSSDDSRVFPADLEPLKGKLEISSKAQADEIVAGLAGGDFRVSDIKERTSSSRPTAPFTTAALQRAASSRLGMSPSATMSVAQRLYEGVNIGAEGGQVGLITYMRTDSTQVARSAQQEARAFISEAFGRDLVPARPPLYRTKSRSAQEAHEAIRPTSVYRTPESVAPYLDRRQNRLYELIWRQFVGSQMKPARIRRLTVLIEGSKHGASIPYRFRAGTSETVFQGHFVVTRAGAKTNKAEEIARQVLLSLNPRDGLLARSIDGIQHFTEPPPRYTEASLIRELEECGIGRPSTYAPTIDTLRRREYVEIERRALRPTPLGESVTDAMVRHFPEIVDKAFTSRMESDLDLVASGDRGRVDFLSDFWGEFSPTLATAKDNIQRVKAPVEKLDEDCPECGKGLILRSGRSGKFVGCSGYPDCRYTRAVGIGVQCPECHDGEVVERRTRRGRRRRKFYGCSRYPDCDYASWKRPTGETCPVCGKVLYAAGRGKLVCEECGHKNAAA
ncbi:MAG: type I DNA topoisomerase [Chloroflexi bacterium]|nr:type I DNA topoisomerase [Chloroflexota bacterium]MCY3937018.1 type I DNA topoisomerase [Chloroflexota bacterium]